ncbi:MAG: hypothetical protein MPL62_10630 [Alphaproteobacteria bacterium]|nr:hypothetical protein [Alphaproteobacteria bacterium]
MAVARWQGHVSREPKVAKHWTNYGVINVSRETLGTETDDEWRWRAGRGMFRVNRRSPNIGQIMVSLMFRAKHWTN